MICINDLKEKINNELSEKRRNHIYGVADTAIELAKLNNVNPKKAELAALFHDLYKQISREEMNKLVKEWNIGSKYINNASLAHSKLAAYAMKNLYGVKDNEVIDAVCYHTTGRKNMTTLDKIIYVADGIEPNRDYDEVKENREIAKENLDKACLIGIAKAIEKLKKQGKTEAEIDIDTIEARDYLKKEIEKENI